MKKRIIPIIFTLFASFFMFAFSPAVQKELTNYIDEDIEVIALAEDSIIDTYANVTGDNYKDDKTLYNTLKNNVIPQYKKFIVTLDQITKKFKTKEMQELNSIYANASKIQLEAFEMMVTGLEKQSQQTILKANDKLSVAATMLNSWNEKIVELAKNNKVDLGGDEE